MNSGAKKIKAGGLALMGKLIVALVALGTGLMSTGAQAATSNAQLEQYVMDLCGNPPNPLPSGWTPLSLAIMCTHLGGAASSGGANVSANLGIAAAGSEISALKKKYLTATEEDLKKKSEKGASGDEGGWGFVVSPQYGENIRAETDRENGYNSKLNGLMLGVDYRFSDRFVLGTTLANTKDKATFLYGAGSLKTSNTSLLIYGTWLAGESIALDGYLGYGKLNLDIQREINWTTTINNGFFGTVTGNAGGKQTMAGFSINLQHEIGRINVSPFLSMDIIKTRLDGYDEVGTTTLEMHYADRDVTSLTSNVGLRLDTPYAYGWGLLIPSVRLAAVHEFKNDTQQIRNELVITPGGGFDVATDEPTRNYLNSGFGVVAALNRGAQLFFDYDRRTRDPLLNSWAVSIGVLVGN